MNIFIALNFFIPLAIFYSLTLLKRLKKYIFISTGFPFHIKKIIVPFLLTITLALIPHLIKSNLLLGNALFLLNISIIYLRFRLKKKKIDSKFLECRKKQLKTISVLFNSDNIKIDRNFYNDGFKIYRKTKEYGLTFLVPRIEEYIINEIYDIIKVPLYK